MQPDNLDSESGILSEISRIVSEAPAFTWAVENIASLLRTSAGGALFFVDLDTGSEPLARSEVREFLASAHPCKLLYTMPVRDRGAEVGRLIAAFSDPPLPTDTPQRLARFASEQLGSLFGRWRLRNHRAALRRELEALRQRLADGKVLARARGILIDHHAMSAAAADQWLAEQSRKTGRPSGAIANDLISAHAGDARLTA